MNRLSLAALACLVGHSIALSLPFRPRTPGRYGTRDASDPFNFMNVNNQSGFDIYIATVSVEGHDFEESRKHNIFGRDVQLDTGSSDLWLDTTGVQLTTFQDTGINQLVPYGDGSIAQGPIEIGNVTVGPYTVTQALISAPGTNATENGDKGLMGVGLPGISQVSVALNATNFQGKTVMENIFAANPSLPPYFTVDLSRSETMGSSSGGTFTIGETRSDLGAISNAPKLPVVNPTRWVTLLDGITVAGQSFAPPITAFEFPGQLPTQLVTLLDTGGPLAVIPKMYLDAIYGNVPGAQFSTSLSAYTVPCDTAIDLSFVFGGISYPIHPIDAVVGVVDPTQGGIVCFSGFVTAGNLGLDSSADVLLGVSFLRNVYALFDFGNVVSGTDAPFIQLLATTDTSTAAAEFQSLSAQRNASLMSLGSQPSPTSVASGGSGAGAKSGASRNVGVSIALVTFAGVALGIGIILI
ncbi:acid protease [Rickenella mellea]|uniref:Acid protease n=1 Tax=Rickenella mellea TaxID=50990 RepID=A0A4Y7Q0D3_9AGAM|nr:acid protease [Rickenella mellea]